ncbi:Sulfite efflux pump SSU1 [Coccomyxa sp. Obi]|nr:Sulfite efflux pump SSU1 [Coccomyxa sp. Obi]
MAGNCHRKSSRVSKEPTTTLGFIIINFVPSWFAVCMGTGIVAILLHTSPRQFKGLEYISTVFYLLNIVLFVLFLVLSIARYTLYPWVLVRMLKHPGICMFLGTLPMALCTIINGTVLIVVPAFGQWAVYLVQVLWWLDVALTFLSSFVIPMLMFHIHQLALETMTAAWLLPLVPTVVAAASGGLVATVVGRNSAAAILVVSYMLWGTGMGLSFLVMTLYFHRLAVHNLPTSEVIVSAFLPLGPLGQGAFGIIQLAKAAKPILQTADFESAAPAADTIYIVSVLVGLLMSGLGFWWLVHGVSSVLIRQFNGGIVFNMGFWGFIFPLGVYTAAIIAIAQALDSAALSWLAVVFIIVLVCLWFFVAASTVANSLNRKLFVAPCLTPGPSVRQLDTHVSQEMAIERFDG